ncbi:4Fe-4S ferredoxin N-terminal domain-containing protein [Haloferax sp. YSSS75]|uniref:4Fe-4S ferredoxin N-terminal domain-containing protein n=1 Tax=Haloferax sp. YSSS75 TaxID=3388564 RepID=UPI00398D5DBB
MATQPELPDASRTDEGQYTWNRDAATRCLDGSPFDTELGLRMSRDAIRVANGVLDEDVFQSKYHEAVVAEFGEDNRPSKQENFDDE